MSSSYIFFSLSAIINLVVSFIFGLLILFRNKEKNTNRIFAIFCFSVSAWSLPYVFWPFSTTAQQTLLWFQLLHISACYVSILYFHFVIRWLELYEKKKKLLYLGYILASIFVLSIPTPLFIKEVIPKFSMNYWAEPGILYHFYLIMFFGFFLYSSFLLYKSYKKSIGAKKYQIKFILIGMIIGFIGGSSNYFLWYDINLPPYGNILCVSFVLFTAYAIIKYRFMDSRVIARSIAIYFFDSIYTYFVFSFLIILYRFLWGSVYSGYSLLAGIIASPLFVLGLFIIHQSSTKLLNKYVFHNLHDYQIAISKLTQDLNQHTELNDIINLIVNSIKNTMNLERAGILIINSDVTPVKFEIAKVIGFNEHNGISLVTDNLLTKFLEKSQKPLVREEMEIIAKDSKTAKEAKRLLELRDYMEHIEAMLCLPLIINSKLIGMIVLGGKISNEPYTKQDLDILTTLSFQAATAIDNARLYKKVKDFSKTLEQKVDEQTKDLQEKATHLEKLLQMRTEFLDTASHQLKTPISVIRGTLSMFEEGSMDRLPKAEQMKFFHSMKLKADKLNAIISDILRASELDTDEFKIAYDSCKPENIEEMIRSIIEQLKPTIEGKKIDLKLEVLQKNLPPVMTSGEFLEQAIYNLVDNAIKYTPQGYVKIILSKDNRNLIIKVQDSGIGIPANEVGKIFDKFARGSNAVDVYANGSGLGLFIVKRIVEAHQGGKVWLESVKGKGTTFTVSLPFVIKNDKSLNVKDKKLSKVTTP